MLETPVLFIVFNRPEPTRQVFNAIRAARPRQLFIAADGPRAGKEGEAERCAEVRHIVSKVDWDCTVHTRFQEENLGCGKGVSSAISWFFEHVEQGIILEDDCLPSPSFFPFCATLLERYKNDSQISIISGFNIDMNHIYPGSYFFTQYAGIWGWASWRRAWKNYDREVPEARDKELMNRILSPLPPPVAANLRSQLNEIVEGRLDTWDYQWWFYRIKSGPLGIVPSVNLIQNIGFGTDATHTTDAGSFVSQMNTGQLGFPLVHPPRMLQKQYARVYEQVAFGMGKRTLTARMKQLVRASLRRFKKRK